MGLDENGCPAFQNVLEKEDISDGRRAFSCVALGMLWKL